MPKMHPQMKVIKMLKELDENLGLLATADAQLREATTDEEKSHADQFFMCTAQDAAESYRRLVYVLKVGDDLCDLPPFESVSTWR
jgi:hypothetical protein